MKFEDYIQKLQKFAEENPEALEVIKEFRASDLENYSKYRNECDKNDKLVLELKESISDYKKLRDEAVDALNYIRVCDSARLSAEKALETLKRIE